MTTPIQLIRILVAVIVGAAGGTVVTTGAAYASACPAGTGVTVVVNSSVGCDRNGGGSAASNVSDAGHSVSNYRGFVCSVDGSPDPAKACHSYAPANAYWGLFWSDGMSGKWSYASSGAYSLNVPAGGWVALKFQTSSSTSYPGITPYTARPAPGPKPTAKSSTATAGPKATPSAIPSLKPATRSPTKSSTKSPSVKSSARPSTPSAQGTTGTTQPGEDLQKTAQATDGSSSLGWVAGALAVVLLASMGAVMWRRSSAGGRTS